MTQTDKPFIIALEEHYSDPAVQAAGPTIGGMYGQLMPRLNDLGELRLKEMDEAGIDVQVISHGPSPIHQVEAASAVKLAR